MYNPPIETIIGKMQMQYEGEILRAVQNIGINVDKDELIRALQYDRNQYDNGYEDGFRRGRCSEIVRCKDCKYSKQSDVVLGVEDFKCLKHNISCLSADDYCSYGERREE